MSSWTSHIAAVALLAGTAVLAPLRAWAQASGPIDDLFLPLEIYPDGKVKTLVRAGTARIPERGGDIEASKVRFEFLGQDGSTQAMVTAESCTVNKDTRVARSTTPIRVEKNGVVITGNGFTWNSTNQQVSILSDVRVVLRRELMPELKQRQTRMKANGGDPAPGRTP